jgi:hypothetical protein
VQHELGHLENRMLKARGVKGRGVSRPIKRAADYGMGAQRSQCVTPFLDARQPAQGLMNLLHALRADLEQHEASRNERAVGALGPRR